MLAQTACVGGAWKAARSEDSIAGYYRFLRDHPDSEHVGAAQERLDFRKLERSPSLAGLARFREIYPESSALEALRVALEDTAFAAARAEGSPEAYERFVEEYGDGALARRASGNAAYLRSTEIGTDVAALARFADEHPQSDFAAEARRSVDAVFARTQGEIDQLGLKIELTSATPEAARVAKAFSEWATKAYADSRVTLVPLSRLLPVDSSPAPRAILRIRHAETYVDTRASGSDLATSGFEAKTIVSIEVADAEAPIWRREFNLRVNARDHLAGHSLLFEPRAASYWDDFFVPVVRWDSSAAVRPVVPLGRRATGIDSVGDRAVVVFEDGGFRVLHLADPVDPVVLMEYERPSDFKRWTGVRVLGDKVILFGEDGLEVVGFTATGPELVFARPRGSVGSITAVVSYRDDIVLASNRGLLLLQPGSQEVLRVLQRPVTGLARSGENLVFSDDDSVFVSTLSLLREGRVISRLKVGSRFAPRRVRVFGNTAIVIGDAGVLLVDLSKPAQPRVLSQFYARSIGPVEDAARVGSRTFLLGPRGLLVLAPNLDSVMEAVDLKPGHRLSTMGRHLVAIGDEFLGVVDATPFASSGSAALSR